MNKRDWVLKAMRNGEADKVPVGFWYHYLQDELEDGLKNPALIEQSIAGHKKFCADYQPDFLKIMTDGFFIYPNEPFAAEDAGALKTMRPLGKDHPWIQKQLEFCKTITGLYAKDMLCFYNVFSSATTFRFVRHHLGKQSETALACMIAQDREAVQNALAVAARDLATLAQAVITEGGADGIYYSVQDQDGVGEADQAALFEPADAAVLGAANKAGAAKPSGALNLLHICGYSGHRNVLARYAAYPAQVINWASVCEGVSLEAGKKLFGGKPVIGGFDNNANGLLFTGTEQQVKDETRRLIAAAGRKGVIIGADCTIPRGTDLRRLNWVREAAG